MTQLIFKESLVVFTAQSFADHDLSLKGSDGVAEVTSKRRARNLRQLPDYTRFASRLVLIDWRSPGLESFTAFPVQKRISA